MKALPVLDNPLATTQFFHQGGVTALSVYSHLAIMQCLYCGGVTGVSVQSSSYHVFFPLWRHYGSYCNASFELPCNSPET